MKFLNILLGAAATGSALGAPSATTTTKEKRVSKFKYVGVNQSGAEFGRDTLPGQLGKHYTWPVKSTIDVSFQFWTNYAGWHAKPVCRRSSARE